MNKQDWVWYELMTTDVDAAIAFHSSVVGWKTEEMGGPQMRYTVCTMDKSRRGVAGIVQLNAYRQVADPKPGWTGFLYADDVDGSVKKAAAAGASVLREPMDIPGTGRFAVMADPQGAIFQFFKPIPPDGVLPETLAQDALGNVGWQELGAKDWQKEWEFYSGQFSWTLGEGYDMGPMGRYQCFSSNEQPMTGGMMSRPPEQLEAGDGKARWAFYFNVDHIRRAQERVEAGGGRVIHGPSQVPGGGWILMGIDPQGAAFSLLSKQG